MSLSCVHRIYRCFFLFRYLSASFFVFSTSIDVVLKTMEQIYVCFLGECVCVFVFSFSLFYSCKIIAINLNWMKLCNEMKWMQNFKQSNDLSILSDILCWIFVCQFSSHYFRWNFCKAYKKNTLIDWEALFQKKFVTIFTGISLYCSFSPI